MPHCSRQQTHRCARRRWNDLLSRSGYLAELSSSLFWDTPGLYDKLLPILTGNNVVLSDNSIEYLLGETENHEVETTRVQNALDVSSLPLFAQAGFSDDIYLGIVANSPRFDACLQFLAYLAAWKASD